jgi:predicted RNA-binding Zn-ribbon protein involved in translation (DUF1610 family)
MNKQEINTIYERILVKKKCSCGWQQYDGASDMRDVCPKCGKSLFIRKLKN